jgi:GntR family transcriptional regulator
MSIEEGLDRENRQKLYIQMSSVLKGKIRSGEWPAGSQIPTEDELCRRYAVSRATVRTAVADLVRGGYLRKQQGRGTFVENAASEPGVTMRTKLTEEIFGEGVAARKELLMKGLKVPPADVQTHLRTKEPVHYILCKRVVNGEAACLEESFIPREVIPDIEEAEVCHLTFYEMMQSKAKKTVRKVLQMIEVADVTEDAAAILKSGNGSSMLLLHRLLMGRDGTPLAYTRLMGGGRKYKVQTELVQLS